MKKTKVAWIAALCIALAAGSTGLGTFAYLKRETDPVENTFVAGDILKTGDTFELKEHVATDTDKDGVYTLGSTLVTENKYTVLPGVDIPKDPKVYTGQALELDAYVFVEVVDSTSAALTVTVDSAKWTLMTDVTGKNGGKVYKRAGGIVQAGGSAYSESILLNDKVTVANTTVTDPGEVTFYGYMIQAAGFNSAEAAWAGL